MQFIYLLISIYFGKKNPLFFLIFPLALIQGPGAFIDTRTVLVLPEFFLLGRNILMDITMFYLIFVVIYLRHKANFKLLSETPMKWYLIYIVFLIILTIITSSLEYEAIAVIRLWLYMLLGYFVLILIFSSAKLSSFVQFFNVLFWVNAIQSVFYVLNSSHILPLYDQSLIYLEVESNSGTFTRDFYTIPIFSGLLFIYGISTLLLNENKFNRKAVYATVITFPFVILFTFTRSVLVTTVIELILIFVIVIRFRSSAFFKPYTIVMTILSIIIFIVLKSSFENEFNYFNERMNGVVEEGTKEGNVDIRIQYHQKAIDILDRENSLILGTGLNKRNENNMATVGAWAADSTIPYLLIYTGLLGVLLFYWNSFYFLLYSAQKKFFELNSLAISLFSISAASIISSFIMGGNSWGSPLMFFNFVLIIYLKQTHNNECEQDPLSLMSISN